LFVEPSLEFIHQRLAISLMVSQTCLGVHPLIARRFIMIKHLLDHIHDHPAFAWKHLFDVAKLATPMRQAVAANHQALIDFSTR
jgi:DNA-binding transcriptional regulator YdaS (Cro superfamily)